ncbi:MAG: Crp/Fnr family transcriptional regulator, partial [Microcystaceae cyanobacterium]
MAKTAKNPPPTSTLLEDLISQNYLFQGMTAAEVSNYIPPDSLKLETLFSNRPIYTAFLPDQFLDGLYLTLHEGIVITRSTPLDRIIAITYQNSVFGMRSLNFSYGLASRAFPCLVE